MSASQTTPKEAPYYYVPGMSAHPIRTSLSMLTTLVGAALWINHYMAGYILFRIGVACLLCSLYFWFDEAIRESDGGLNSKRVDSAYRWSMEWFIFFEVVLCWAFLFTLWYMRDVSSTMFGDIDH